MKHRPEARLKIVEGNLLSRQDCEAAVKDVAVIYHLAAGSARSPSRMRL